MGSGYFRQPTVSGDTVIFVCEADLWSVGVEGGVARRLTSHQVDSYWPHFSPNGKLVAFSAVEEGAVEVYVMPAEGGPARRLTYQGASNLVVGFTPDGKNVIYSSNAEAPLAKMVSLWTVPVDAGSPRRLDIGPARRISHGPQGAVVISRREQEIARWKRYKGGTKGDLWIDAKGDGHWVEILKDLEGNLGSPCIVGDRLYFVADHDGHGNVYSCAFDGSDLKCLTNHQDFYARALTTDGKRLVYQCGAEIFLLDPARGKTRRLEIEVHSTRQQLTRRFVSPVRYLNGYQLHPEGHSLLVTTRGKPFLFGNWEREVTQLGQRDGVRYRLASWLSGGKKVVAVSDEGGEEALEILGLPDATGLVEPARRFADLDLGRIRALVTSPVNDAVAVSNHRAELHYVDLEAGTSKLLGRGAYADVSGLSFSPCGRYVAYSTTEEMPFSQIFVADVNEGTTRAVTRTVGHDYAPCFDPEGKYLHFLSARVFDPVYDSIRFDLGFPKGIKPYLITLRKDLESPFHPAPRPFDKADKKSEKPDLAEKAEKAEKPAEKPVTGIDFDGIEDRILEYPVSDGRYQGLAAAKGRVFFSEAPIEGALGRSWHDDKPAVKLMTFDFETQKSELFAEAVDSFSLSRDGKTLAYGSRDRLRVVKAQGRPDAKETKAGRASGYVDLDRVRVEVMPAAEWKQMFREMWRLQRDHFWTTDLSQVDWPEVYERYLPILGKVSTRAEFSDLAWEVQGELGTSHAYEMGGDLKAPPPYPVGKLGVDLVWNGRGWEILKIVRGDSWESRQSSPLAAPGINAAAGDLIVAVDGIELRHDLSVGQALVHKAGVDVGLTLEKADGSRRRVVVRPLHSDARLRYRAWVEANRQRVLDATGGRIGYVHVPDMGPLGYSEFFRYFTRESYRDGLVVDVRFNGGGHVSQFLLEKLMRKRVSYMVSHHLKPMPEPNYSVEGPIVAITNEFAGSDGDIFSHSFKWLKLGKLVGKRTWGGVVGISGNRRLVDGTLVTQPEWSTWFKDVAFGVENYGTDPDIEVDVSPDDHRHGKDPQLERAIAVALAELEAKPPFKPDFSVRPNLARKPSESRV